MLQRIQSVYLFITVVVCGVGAFLIPDWSFGDKELLLIYNETYLAVWYLAMAVLALITIFLFTNRPLQMRLIKINTFLNVVLLGFFVYWFLNLPGEINFSEIFSKKGIGALSPLLSIVFLRMAHKAIKKDDNLVKSVDRLR